MRGFAIFIVLWYCRAKLHTYEYQYVINRLGGRNPRFFSSNLFDS